MYVCMYERTYVPTYEKEKNSYGNKTKRLRKTKINGYEKKKGKDKKNERTKTNDQRPKTKTDGPR